MGSRVKTAILVTFFTALIWVLAEGESLQTKRAVVDVEFPTTVSEAYTARLADGGGRVWRVEALVEGSTASLEALDEVLRRAVALEPGMEGVPRESGEHTVDLREALRGHPEFRSRGVAVLTVEPPTVRIVVDQLVTRSFPIRVEAPLEALEGAATLSGADQAEVRLPARVLDSLSGAGEVVARVSPEDLASLQEGVRSRLPVRLEPGPGLASAGVLGIEPATVDVQLTVRTQTQTIVIPTLNIDIRGQLDQLSKWEITVEPPDLQNVRVTGPSELIAKIEARTLKLRPFVWVEYDELKVGTLTRRVQFSDYTNDPQALNLRFEVEDDTVEVTIQPRAGSGEPVQGGAPPPG